MGIDVSVIGEVVCVYECQDEYVEYSRHGTLLKGQEKIHVKSRFEEDVYINNHTVNIYHWLNKSSCKLLFEIN